MRVLVLGGDGMLGHQLFRTLRRKHDVRATLRRSIANYERYGIFDRNNAFADVDVRSPGRLREVIERFSPAVVVNCVGHIKQRDDAQDPICNLEINALLPHRLAATCGTIGARVIQVSTDCVFSGRRGMYREEDTADADDVYGRTKRLGEPIGVHCLTLRTSMVGRELARKRGLVEWFLAQNEVVKGYRQAKFSGVSTIEFSRVIDMVLGRFPPATGLYHVSAEPIDKYALLCLLRERFGKSIEIVPDDTVVLDRSLDSSKFRSAFGYGPPSWAEMVTEI